MRARTGSGEAQVRVSRDRGASELPGDVRQRQEVHLRRGRRFVIPACETSSCTRERRRRTAHERIVE